MPLWIIVKATAVKALVAVSNCPFDNVMKHSIIKVKLECDGIVESHIFMANAIAQHRA